MASILTKWLAHGAVHHSLPLSLSPRRRANTRTHEHGRRRHHNTQKQIIRTLLNMSNKKQHDKRAPTWRTFIRSRPFASCLCVCLAASSTRHATWRGGSAQPGSGEVFLRHEATFLCSLSHRWRKIQVGPWYWCRPQRDCRVRIP